MNWEKATEKNNTKNGFRSSLCVVVASCLALAVAGCAASPAIDISNPVERKVAWYSYLNGDDMRQWCQAGAPERYRFVMNGVYIEHIRIHELEVPEPASGLPTSIRSHIIEETDVSVFGEGVFDILAPARSDVTVSDIPRARADGILTALRSSGFYAGSQPGLRLNGDEFYWIAVGCHDGQFLFDAWSQGRGTSPPPAFVAPLIDAEPSGVAVPDYQVAPLGTFERNRRDQYDFTLITGVNGLALLP